MKTRKTKTTIFGKVLLATSLMCMMITGCKKDGDSDLQGYWSAKPVYDSYDGCNIRNPVYEFVNGNTAFQYVNVFDNRIQGYATKEMPDHDGWYYVRKQTMTYSFVDNKLIFTNGDIYTYMNGKLYEENTSTVLSRWKTATGNNDDNIDPQDAEMTNKLINTTWRFVKSVTYFKSSGKTETDTNSYGTISFRSSFDGSNSRILTVNGEHLGRWWYKDGEIHITYTSGTTSSQNNLLINICGSGVIKQLTSSDLHIVRDLSSSTTTFYYTRSN